MIRILLSLPILVLVGCGDQAKPDDSSSVDPFVDADGDGVSAEVDCDEADPLVGAASSWFVDGDGDGYGSPGEVTESCEAGAGLVANDDDCDDANGDIHPGAAEVCDGVDTDCDGVDNGADTSTWYLDGDGDGYGGTWSVDACEAPAGFVATSDDCDDMDSSSNPSAVEVCDGADNDCDTLVDDADDSVTGQVTWVPDGDGDGYGTDVAGTPTVTSCDQPTGHADNADDCDDLDPALPEVLYADDDGDGFGDTYASTLGCSQVLTGYVATPGDCDDADAGVSPAEVEVCGEGGVDEDCDGLVDDGDDSVSGTTTWYVDGDGDGYGDSASATVQACTAPSGYAAEAGDCDDGDNTVLQGEVEVCDGVDNDCDGVVDWGVAVPTDYSTISDAVQAASSGDTICLGAGYYTESIDFDGKWLNLEGAGSATTTIDAYGLGAVLTLAEGESGSISGVTLTGGSAAAGAGVYVIGGDVVLDDVAVIDNECRSTTSACYGVVYVSRGSLTMDNVEVTDNNLSSQLTSSTDYVYGTLYAEFSTVDWSVGSLSDNTVEGGPYTYSYLYGGGIYATSSDLSLSGVDIENNRADSSSSTYGYNYGFIYLLASDLEFDAGVISNNTTYSRYYNYYFFYNGSGSELSFTDAEVSDNTMTSTCTSTCYAYYFLYNYYSTARFQDSLVSDNVQEASSSSTAYAYYGVYNYYGLFDFEGSDWVGNEQTGTSTSSTGYAYYVFYNYYGTASFKQGRYSDNTIYASGSSAYAYYGFYNYSATLELTNMIFSGNSREAAATGSSSYASYGWIYHYGSTSSLTIENSDVVANSIIANYGYTGFLYAAGSDTATITNTTFAWNDFDVNNYNYGNLYYASSSSSSTLDFTYNNVYGNGDATADFYAGGTVTYVGSNGNISADPGYTDTSATDTRDWDFTLTSGSSMVDAGDPSIQDDDGTTSDIGAYGGPYGGW